MAQSNQAKAFWAALANDPTGRSARNVLSSFPDGPEKNNLQRSLNDSLKRPNNRNSRGNSSYSSDSWSKKGIIDKAKKAASQVFDLTRTVEANRIELQKSFGKNSAFASDFTKDLEKKGRNLADLAASYDELTVASTVFADGYSKTMFDPMAKTIEQYGKMVIINKRFGLSTDETLDYVNKLTIGADLSGQQIENLGLRMFRAQHATGVPYTKLIRDLKENFSDLSDHVSEVKTANISKEFMRFSAIAKKTGESVSTLVGMTKQFDTIGSGMASGGKMNRLLQHFGSSFDTAKAMMMSRSQRMGYIISRVAKAGDRFRQGNEHQRRAMMVAFRDTGLPEGLIRQALIANSASKIQSLMKRSMDTNLGGAKGAIRKRAGELTSNDERKKAWVDGLLPVAVSLEKGLTLAHRLATALIRRKGPNIAAIFGGTTAGKALTSLVKTVLTNLNDATGEVAGKKNTGLSKPVIINWTKGSRIGEMQVNALSVRTNDSQASAQEKAKRARQADRTQSSLDELNTNLRILVGRRINNPAGPKPKGKKPIGAS